MSYHKNFPAHQRTDETDQPSKPAKQSRPPIETLRRAVEVLANPRADDADKLRAWLRAGLEIGALTVRDVDRLHALKR